MRLSKFALFIVMASAVFSSAQAGATVSRGQYLAILGDCAGCHSAPHKPAFSGGKPFTAAFGTVYSTNITPDPKTGIGRWTEDQFYRALHDGIAADDSHLYPAFPYAYFTHISQADTGALFAYLKTLKPVVMQSTPNRLLFPFNIRTVMMVWNWLFLDDKVFTPNPKQTASWNRGKYIVTGLGHCAACHTPKNIMFGDLKDKPLAGTVLDNWFAANLSTDRHEGIGKWKVSDIARYFAIGRNQYATAAGSMLQKVEQSTSRMTDSDREAVAVYLKSIPPQKLATPLPPQGEQMLRGEAIFSAHCATCHERSKPDYPQLDGDTLVLGRDPTTVVRMILEGGAGPANAGAPQQKPMPAFAKLNDGEIADVATFIRNARGNRASPVSATDVIALRRAIAATPGG
jgi:mono/diheme cytochrome c family protein